MSVSSVKTGAIGDSLLAGNAAYDPGDFVSIATVTVGAGGASTVSFSSIPSTYQHLQIRYINRDTNSGTADNPLNMQFNGDTSNGNYKVHRMQGNGSTTGADAYSYPIAATGVSNNNTNTFYAAGVIDVLDYANTNKYKTVKSLSGWDSNGSGIAWLMSELWMNTSAVSSLTFSFFSGGNFGQYSSFALYGIKG